MSVADHCQAYRSSVGPSWKQALGNIIAALHTDNHLDEQRFAGVAHMLMMKDKPGYWHWLDTAVARLIDDSTSRLDPIPDLPDYDEMSVEDLLNRYEMNDQDFRQTDILNELHYRHPSLIKSTQIESIDDLREKLKDALWGWWKTLIDFYSRSICWYEECPTLRRCLPFIG